MAYAVESLPRLNPSLFFSPVVEKTPVEIAWPRVVARFKAQVGPDIGIALKSLSFKAIVDGSVILTVPSHGLKILADSYNGVLLQILQAELSADVKDVYVRVRSAVRVRNRVVDMGICLRSRDTLATLPPPAPLNPKPELLKSPEEEGQALEATILANHWVLVAKNYMCDMGYKDKNYVRTVLQPAGIADNKVVMNRLVAPDRHNPDILAARLLACWQRVRPAIASVLVQIMHKPTYLGAPHALARIIVIDAMTPPDLTLEDIFLGDQEKNLNTDESTPIRVEHIQRIVAHYYGVSRQEMLGDRRTRVIVKPRQVAMYLAKTLTPRSFPEIGRRFGGRDHTTVLHAVRKMDALITNDENFRKEIELLETKVRFH